MPITETIYTRIRAMAQPREEKPAILSVASEIVDYTSLCYRLGQGQEYLRERYVGLGDAVILVMPTGPEMALSVSIVASSNPCAPLNANCSREVFGYFIEALSPKLILVAKELETPVRAAAADANVPLADAPPWMAELVNDCSTSQNSVESIEFRLPDPDAIALLMPTSGTTSYPKIVPLSHRNLCKSADYFAKAYQLDENDRCLSCMPLQHIHGMMAGVFANLLTGGSTVCAPKFDADDFSRWLHVYKPTWLTGVPTYYQAVLKLINDRGGIEVPDSLRFIRSASSSLPPSVMARLESTFGVPVLESYAMTEAAAHISVNPLPPLQRKPGSVGLPAGPEVAILNGKGAIGADHTGLPGEIAIRGDNVINCYFGEDSSTQGLFKDGWLLTGDQGHIDEDGYLYISGRLKELIVRGGHNIAPREIEDALLGYPGVTQAAAFAVTHPTLGQDAVAAVVMEGDSQFSESEIREYLGNQLIEYKVPSRVLDVDILPRSSAGKVQRSLLAEQFADELKSSFNAPAGQIEEELAQMWVQVLQTSGISRNDNFFALGGDSLLAAQLAARIEERFHIYFDSDNVLTAMTFSRMSECVIEAMIGCVDIAEVTKYIDSMGHYKEE